MKKFVNFIKNHKKISIISIILVILLISAVVVYFVFFNKKEEIKPKKKEHKVVEIKKLKIIDEESKTRPYAVMINNHSTARKYHAGLQDAYMVYEIIVEGGITRMMALFKDQNTEKIGSVRSARHYFLDYALENDAMYVHWGWSPQAQSDISNLSINNINGLTYEGTYFFRDKSLRVSSEHTGFTSMEKLKQASEKLNYRKELKKDILLNYSVDNIDLSTKENAIIANNIEIPYSQSVKTSYVYDNEAKVYKRFVNGIEHKDHVTGNQYTTKNIITYQLANKTIAGDQKGRQDVSTVGSGEGYYITNGYAIPITWEKESRSSQTIYKYQDGKEININDGNTFIQIQPSNLNLSIS